VIFFLAVQINFATASDYRIGIGDVLSVSFWQNPEFNITTKVNENGLLSLKLGGSFNVQGLTFLELEQLVVDRMSVFDRQISKADVAIVEYGSQKIYVMGEIANPGSYSFEKIPNLWHILAEAGGPTPDANLSNLLIVRYGKDEKNTVMQVDLSVAILTNSFELLPKIEPGDYIYILNVRGDVPHSGISALQAYQNEYYVYGEINNAGVFTFNKKLSLLEAIVAAGGPSSTAKLKDVRVIRNVEKYTIVTKVDVKKHHSKNHSPNFYIKSGDIIYIPNRLIRWEESISYVLRVVPAAIITGLLFNYILDK
jgi:protein involved in polysaccharide export with SLBB domain